MSTVPKQPIEDTSRLSMSKLCLRLDPLQTIVHSK